MAITQASLTSGSEVQVYDATSVTASISPTANRLVIVAVFTTFAPPEAGSGTITGASMTWDAIGSESETAAGMNVTLFRALSASPGSGALTITHANGPDSCFWAITEFDGVDTGGTNGSAAVVQFASNTDISASAATVTATLSAFGSADNGAYSAHAFFNQSALPTATPDTGWTEIHDFGSVMFGSFAGAIETQWRNNNDTTALATWTQNGAVFATAVEIKASAVAFLAEKNVPILQAVKRASQW